MVTIVGKQEKFSDAVCSLLELDFDAIEAYKEAIKRVKNSEYQLKLTEFMQDHERHVQELTSLLQTHQIEAPQGADIKQWLTKGKVIIADLIGDKPIIIAMLSNEMDTNSAYENMLAHENIWDDAAPILTRGLADEVKHKQYLENILGR